MERSPICWPIDEDNVVAEYSVDHYMCLYSKEFPRKVFKTGYQYPDKFNRYYVVRKFPAKLYKVDRTFYRCASKFMTKIEAQEKIAKMIAKGEKPELLLIRKINYKRWKKGATDFDAMDRLNKEAEKIHLESQNKKGVSNV
jgi:hypothetical protein